MNPPARSIHRVSNVLPGFLGKTAHSVMTGLLGLLALLPHGTVAAEPGTPAKAGEPLLWVLRDADSTVYLYGTIHLRRKGGAWGGPKAKAAFAESQRLWTEILLDPAQEAAATQTVLRLGLDPSRKLPDRIDPAKKPALLEAAAALGMPLQAIEPMRPWLASMTLLIGTLTKAGYDPTQGVDRLLDAEARAAGKTLRSFETSSEQVQFLAGLTDSVQLDLLHHTLEEFKKGPELMKQLETAWEQGDESVLRRLAVDEMRITHPELDKILLGDRNRRWADKIGEILAGSGVDFVAVGAAHLTGPESVQAMLAKRNLKAVRVTP
jgi:uncharacterized protein YbaP (TraB family)